MTDEKYEVQLVHHENLLDNLLTHEFPDEKALCWMQFVILLCIPTHNETE